MADNRGLEGHSRVDEYESNIPMIFLNIKDIEEARIYTILAWLQKNLS